MPVLSPSERRLKRDRLLAVIGGGAFVAVVLGFVYSYQLATQARIELDSSTLCPAVAGPDGHLALVIDASEPFNEVQRAFLLRELDAIEARIPPYHQVSVFVLDGTEATKLPEATFQACKPRTADTANEWTENPRMIEEQWRSKFHEPLRRAIQEGLHHPDANYSPIMEIVQAVSVQVFPPSEVPKPTRIVLISDLLQHSNGYSQYNRPRENLHSFLESTEASAVRTDLSGTLVDVLYIRRTGAEQIQGREHLDFWKDYFVWLGVGQGELSIVPVEG